MNTRKIELLAPAGNFMALKAAIANGANAVYLGGKNFSARAFANNFDEEELKEAIRYAHLRDVRIYVTLNTLLNENEFNKAKKMVDFYYENKVDALLIQDFGLYYYIKNKYPDFELHCSTQMHVHNIEGIKTAKKLGFRRVVLARESDLELIKEACKCGIEIETFVHGAICVAYSGQCLMSSFSKNRSANKGMCAQCCRLKYEILDEDNNHIATDTDYLLSPKDMYLLNDIDKLIEAGVSSFKIEGRMKSSAYVGYVTRVYRKAIDDYLASSNYQIDEEVNNNLRVLFNRNFTNDLLYNKNNLFGQKTPNHLGIKIGEVLKQKDNKTYIRLTQELNQFDGIRIGQFGCIVNRLYKNDLLVSSGKAGDVIAIDSSEKLKGNVYKTQDYLLEKEINEFKDKQVALHLNIEIKPDLRVLVKLSHNNDTYTYLSDIVADKAISKPLNSDTIKRQFSKLNETAYFLNNIDIDTENAFLTVSQLNEIRRKAIEAFDEYRLSNYKKDNIYAQINYIELHDDKDLGDMVQDNDEIILDNNKYSINYVINPESVYSDKDHTVISEIGGLLSNNEHKIAYYTLNCSNSYCYEFFKKLGFEEIILSSELKENEIDSLIEAYEKRNNLICRPYVFYKGKKVLMYIKTNPFDKYLEKGRRYYLSDGVNKYLIRKKHNLTELIVEDQSDIDIQNKQIKQFTIID